MGGNTSDPLGGDLTTWNNLATEAANGDLQFDPEVAVSAAKVINEAIQQIRNVQAQIDSLEVPTGSFGVLPGGAPTKLEGAFTGTSNQLDGVLNAHLKILNDMLDTFVNAGINYHEGDSSNASLFNNMGAPTAAIAPGSAGGLTGKPTPETLTYNPIAVELVPVKRTDDYYYKTLNPALPTAPSTTRAGVQYTPMTPQVLNLDAPQSMDLADLWALGNAMQPQTVANTGGNWDWLSTQLDQTFGQLRSSLGSITNNNWRGYGQKTAMNAISDYSGQTTMLTSNMNLVRDNLLFAANWLNGTKPNMPPSPISDDEHGSAGPTATMAELVAPYLPYYQNVYMPGADQTNSALLSMPNPNPVTNGGGGNGGLGNGGGGNGGLGSGGPASGGLGSGGLGSGGLGSGGSGSGGLGDTGTGTGGLSTDGGSTGLASTGLGGTGTGSTGDGGLGGTGAGTDGGLGSTGVDSGSATSATDPASAAEQALSAAQQAAQTAAQTAAAAQQASALTNPGLAALNQEKAAAAAAKEAAALGKLGAGGGGLGGAGALADEAAVESKLFPRAALAQEEESLLGRAGMVASAGTSGAPGSPMGGGAGAKGNEEKEKKKAEYLNSKKHLEEAFGTAPAVVKPVIEQ